MASLQGGSWVSTPPVMPVAAPELSDSETSEFDIEVDDMDLGMFPDSTRFVIGGADAAIDSDNDDVEEVDYSDWKDEDLQAFVYKLAEQEGDNHWTTMNLIFVTSTGAGQNIDTGKW